jgi:transposase
MKKTRRQYTREFKREALRLLETSGKSASQIEQGLAIGKGNLWRWKRKLTQDGENAFRGHGRLTPEQERIRELEPKNEILRQPRDILKKAVAIFSHLKVGLMVRSNLDRF